MLEHEDLTRRVIAAAIQVHATLGPGFIESIYEGALALELRRQDVPFARQVEIPVRYRGEVVGVHRLDLLVCDEIVVELKAVRDLTPQHFMVVRSYLSALGRRHGLILNFSAAPLEIRRVIRA